jgi:hypothetical protein
MLIDYLGTIMSFDYDPTSIFIMFVVFFIINKCCTSSRVSLLEIISIEIFEICGYTGKPKSLQCSDIILYGSNLHET